jgi:hypothetical protein
MENNSKYLYTVFWQQCMEANNLVCTDWGNGCNEQSKEHTRPEDDWTAVFGKPTIKARVIGATIPVKNVPMCSEARVRKFQMVCEHTDTRLRFKTLTRSAGTPYADSAQGEECWDVEKTGDGLLVRHSFKIHFHSRPVFVASKIENGMTQA